MARARGANAVLAAALNSGAYGAIVATGNYRQYPVAGQAELGDEQGLIASDLLGFGREPQEPGDDVINNEGSITVPVDLRNFGFWLKLLFGAPTSTVGVRASGNVAFSANPANNATITLNGVVVTFVTGTPAGNQVKIGATLADTIQALVIFLNTSANATIGAATYSCDLNYSQLNITHDTIGTGGNAFSLAASTSPVSNGTVSAANLSGGATTGPTNHVFVSGALTVPDACMEVGMPDLPSFAMNYGVMGNTLGITLQRSGLLNAKIGLVAQGELPRTATTATGSLLTQYAVERFSQWSGLVSRDGVPLGKVQGGEFNYSNGLDKDESIRSDGRIGGADPGAIGVNNSTRIRFADTVLLDLAIAKTAIEQRFDWSISAAKSLSIVCHRVRLPKPRFPINGPGGIEGTFAAIGAEDQTLQKSVTVTLVNDVASY